MEVKVIQEEFFRSSDFRKNYYPRVTSSKTERCRDCGARIYWFPIKWSQWLPCSDYDLFLYAGCLWGRDHRQMCGVDESDRNK